MFPIPPRCSYEELSKELAPNSQTDLLSRRLPRGGVRPSEGIDLSAYRFIPSKEFLKQLEREGVYSGGSGPNEGNEGLNSALTAAKVSDAVGGQLGAQGPAVAEAASASAKTSSDS